MTYDDISSEISKLKSQLSQRKSQFSDAKTGVEELKSVFTNFDNNNLNYDKKDYQKAISLFDSGDYKGAQYRSRQAIQEGQSTFSAMSKVGCIMWVLNNESITESSPVSLSMW